MPFLLLHHWLGLQISILFAAVALLNVCGQESLFSQVHSAPWPSSLEDSESAFPDPDLQRRPPRTRHQCDVMMRPVLHGSGLVSGEGVVVCVEAGMGLA